MTKVIKKTFAYFDKEEQWLNQMSREGYALENYQGGRYYFETAKPNSYQYKIELLDQKNKQATEEYLDFLNEMDIDVLATYSGRVYLRKQNDGRAFAVYTDIDARIKQYQKGHAIWAGIGSSQFSIASILLFFGIQQLNTNNKFWYLTLIFSALLYISGIVFIAYFGKPYRKKIKTLRAEKAINEY